MAPVSPPPDAVRVEMCWLGPRGPLTRRGEESRTESPVPSLTTLVVRRVTEVDRGSSDRVCPVSPRRRVVPSRATSRCPPGGAADCAADALACSLALLTVRRSHGERSPHRPTWRRSRHYGPSSDAHGHRGHPTRRQRGRYDETGRPRRRAIATLSWSSPNGLRSSSRRVSFAASAASSSSAW